VGALQERPQDLAADGGRVADRDDLLLDDRLPARIGDRDIDGPEDLGRLLEQRLPGCRERDGAGRAAEERDAELLLEPPNL
jgi:hypothetical protein